MANPPPLNTPVLDAMMREFERIALKYRVTTLVVAGFDPQTRQPRLFASPNALNDLRELAAEKFQLSLVDESTTGWDS